MHEQTSIQDSPPPGHTLLHSQSATQLSDCKPTQQQQQKSVLKSLSSSELVTRRPPVSTNGIRAVHTRQHKTRENNEISINKVSWLTKCIIITLTTSDTIHLTISSIIPSSQG